MAETVYILGAGASASAKAPMMSGFFQAIEDLDSNNLSEDEIAAKKQVIEARYKLDATTAKVRLGYHENIETVFSTFEIAKVIGRLGDLSAKEIQALSGSLRKIIRVTLERNMEFSIGPTFPSDFWVSGYSPLAGWIKNRTGVENTALVTMNYDIGAEWAFACRGIHYEYCLDGDDSKTQGAIPLLKLHGSLSWGECANCGEISSLDITHKWIRELSMKNWIYF